MREQFAAQARLMLDTLRHVAVEDCFALKGGTAINFFVRDMPADFGQEDHRVGGKKTTCTDQEDRHRSGVWRAQIGETVCVQPGQPHQSELRYALIDIKSDRIVENIYTLYSLSGIYLDKSLYTTYNNP